MLQHVVFVYERLPHFRDCLRRGLDAVRAKHVTGLPNMHHSVSPALRIELSFICLVLSDTSVAQCVQQNNNIYKEIQILGHA